jgi:hypothetical protein
MVWTEEVGKDPPFSSLFLIIYTGKSDPFVVFTLNGAKVHKSQVKKKTLSPEWNETFTVSVVRMSSD